MHSAGRYDDGLDNWVLVYNLRFPGQISMPETGPNYNYFRDYDPQTARYIESGPIGLAGGINTYSYTGSNPISRVDPNGEVSLVLTRLH
jgi:RHS repeat-associated protein